MLNEYQTTVLHLMLLMQASVYVHKFGHQIPKFFPVLHTSLHLSFLTSQSQPSPKGQAGTAWKLSEP
jgi:hypothetical protein